MAVIACHDIGALRLGATLVNKVVTVVAQDSAAGAVPPRILLVPQLQPPPSDVIYAVDGSSTQAQRWALYAKYTLAAGNGGEESFLGPNGDAEFALFVLSNIGAITGLAKQLWAPCLVDTLQHQI